MRFSRFPFVYLVTLLATGIVFADTFSINLYLSISCLFGSVAFAILLNRWRNENRMIASILLLSSFFFIGTLLIQNHRILPVSSSSNAHLEHTSYMVQVEEIASSNKEWRKSICSVFSSVDSLRTIDHSEKILLLLKSNSVEAGDQLLIHSELNLIQNNKNPGEFDAKTFWNNKNVYRIGFVTDEDIKLVGHVPPSWLNNFLTTLQKKLAKILEKHLDGENVGLAKALILGDKDMLSSEVRSSFSNSGAMHVLAVSGLHVGIVLYLIIFVLSRFPRFISKKTALFTAVIIIWIYAGTTGFSPSVLRASFMFTLLTIGQLAGKRVNSINILFFSAFVLLLMNPLLIYDIGFQLSYLAMIGIFTIYKPISRWFYVPNKWLLKIWEGTAVGIAAQLFTVPLTLYYFHQFPNYFALTNIGMMIFAGLVLGLGLFLFVVHWWGFIASFVGIILGISFSTMLFFVQFVESIPGSVSVGFTMTGSVTLAFYCLGIIVLLFNSDRRVLAVSVILSLGLFSFVHFTRFENLSKNEIVLFNNNHVIIAIKHRGKILCLHNVKKEKEKRMLNILADYQKVRPGEVEYLKLINGTTRVNFGGEKFSFNLSTSGVHIVLPESETFIRTKYESETLENVRIIDMPYLERNPSFENLKDGAIFLNY